MQTADTKPTPSSATFQATYGPSCSQAPTVGKHVTNNIVGLCTAGTGAATNSTKMCTLQAPEKRTAAPYTDADSRKAVAAYLTALCTKMDPPPKLTAANIATFISAFTKQLRKRALDTADDKGSYVLGKGNDAATPCAGGADSNQNCVDFKNSVAVASGRDLGNGIAWLKELQKAAGHLVKRTKLIRQKESEQTRMILLDDKIQELYHEALHGELPITKQTQTKLQATPDPERKKACEKHPNKTTCEAKSCKWNGTEETIGKCEAKPEEEQTNAAGTGETAKEGTATYGCATHKDKTAFENEKKDGKQNCGWRKGKGCEDLTGRNKCAEMVVF
uniref:Variant surface glycoprotein n=1 Tax=Trypanosoma brucei TaxID=5691 RepID=A0A1V0FYC3_9TRYP|nr:variant surface glycoprotein [Trypanosoma brucei]